jgi:beta-glucosidase-like glycosyl hydrolase
MHFVFLLAALAQVETLSQMSLDEKIGQLFVAPACPMRGEDHFEDWITLVEKTHVGNAIVKQADPQAQVQFLKRLQAQSEIPFLIAADAEWGLGMRMKDTLSFPRNMTLGAIDDLEWIFKLGAEIGREAKLVGIHLNLAPVADVNNNPSNPIIGMRAFGDDPERVAALVSAYTRGLQSAGVAACAKHFPGHGDTAVDSHADLPLIPHPIERLRAIEWVPFQRAIVEGIEAIMTAHLKVPAIDLNLPASLSPLCTQVLRDFHFEGLIVTDALNMKAVSDRYSPEEVALLARKAGADLLLYGTHIPFNVDEIMKDTIPRAFAALKKGYEEGELDLKELDGSVLRILRLKARIGPLEDLQGQVHSLEALSLKRRLYKQAVSLIGEEVFPIPQDSRLIHFGEGLLQEKIQGDGERVVVAIHSKEALTKEAIQEIEALGSEAIICLFATPYLLKEFRHPKTILVGFENDPDAQLAVLNVLLGKEKARGHLPIKIDGPKETTP